MEKEHSDGLGSLFLLLLAIIAITFCLELTGGGGVPAAKQQVMVHQQLPDTTLPAAAKAAFKRRLVL